MNKIINWTVGSFFRTLGRILVYILLGFLLSYLFKDIKLPNLFTILDVSAETFTQSNRFEYFLYRNSDAPLENGTGLLDSYGGIGYNRVQFLYNLYTFDSKYLYDITFTTYFNGTGGTGVLTANIWAQSCSIYTGSGAQYNCSYTGGYDGNQVYMRSTINNMVGTDLNTLWLNFYSSGVSAVNLLQNSYKLEINRKENKNVTSENIQNATESIINNNNQNTNSIINNQNENNNALRSDVNAGVDHILDSQNNINNNISNSDTLQATNDASSFFNNFTTDTHGLTGIITAPLNAIQSLSSQQCSPLVLPLPFVNEDLTLPCMRTIYTQYFGDFMTLYDIITLGIISYWVMVRIFGLVKDFKNPEHDEIEVLDL